MIKYTTFFILSFLSVTTVFSQDHKQVDSLQTLYDKATVDTIKLGLLSDLSDAWYNLDPKKALSINEQLLEMAEKTLPDYSGAAQKRVLLMKAAALNNLGILAMDRGEVMTGIDYYNQSIAIFETLGNKEYLANAYNNIGFIYENQGDIQRGMSYYFKSLQMREAIGDNRGIGESYNNIAYMYEAQGDRDKSLEIFLKALTYFQKSADQQGISIIYNNVGDIYKMKKKYDTALFYLNKSAVIKTAIADHKGLSSAYVNIGDVFEREGMLDSARIYYDKALDEGKTAGNKSRIAAANQNLASVFLAKGETDKALMYAKESLTLSIQLGFPERIRDSYSILSDIYASKKDYKGAYDAFKSFKEMADSILSDATKQNAVKEQMKYTFDKRELEVKKEKEKSELEHQSEVARQRLFIYVSITILFIVLVFSLFLYNRFRITRKQKSIIEEQKKVVEEQKEMVEVQKEMVDEKNKEITDSINYAKRIQQAILPPERMIKALLPESFIFYKPKDIVAGDFYWLECVGDLIIFSAADCTGHGVPGAMVSVVCHNALNRSVREFGLTETGKILDKTKELVIETFEKSDQEVRDGMDISLCAYNPKTKVMQWSGANNPLWLVRNNELIEYKPDKQPIGKYIGANPFTTVNIQLLEGDRFYLFTDGYADQFGGPKGKKFKYKPLQELLLLTGDDAPDLQKRRLEAVFNDWKGSLEQVDDVCVIGVRV